ncbi:MAG: GntR family transcriptional regulator [Candidatus Fimimonas sp.]
MKLVVSTKSQTPIYEQLYQQTVAQILSGEMKTDESLPSIRFVARELEISVMPVKIAYEKLEKEGYIYTVQGKGCFVAPLSAKDNRQNLARQKMLETVFYCKEMGMTNAEIELALQQCLDE